MIVIKVKIAKLNGEGFSDIALIKAINETVKKVFSVKVNLYENILFLRCCLLA